MTSKTQQLLQAVVAADPIAVQESLASYADVNATDELGRNALHYAALGPAIIAFDTENQIRLSDSQLEVLRLVCQHDQLSLYSLNAPLPWAGGATLLGLMSWLNMSVEITYLFEYTFGLLDVNAMDEQGATPLMYAARDGNMQVVQRLLGQGAKPDIKSLSQKSTVQYSLNHPEILWLCEETLRITRRTELEISSTMQPRKRKLRPSTPFPDKFLNTLFYVGGKNLLSPPDLNVAGIRRNLNSLLQAIRNQDTGEAIKILSNLHGSQSHASSILVNFSDEAGLAPIHYVCSQRYSPSIEIADALYYAGADMGLYSTLGFTPLHHLARTARDPKKDTKELESSSDPIQSVEDTPLYLFTLHLIRHLHAPLRATDGRGETPLHAAAEHGASIAVLKAMLECDKEYFGKESVREMRNERGLRPVDVAKTEFISIFMGELADSLKKPPRPPPLKLPPRTGDVGASAYNTPRSPRPSASFTLVKKGSDMSIKSRSSGSSSKSSGERSQTSSVSHRSGTRQWHKPLAIHGMHANPYPSPPSSYSGSPASATDQLNGSFDVSASAMNVLYNLSLSASALQSYSQPQTDESNVPDLLTISETLAASRDLAVHVLDHWSTQLELAKSEYDLISNQIRKAEGLLSRVTTDIEPAASRPHKREQLYKSLRETKSHSARRDSKTNPDPDDCATLSDNPRASLETNRASDNQPSMTNHAPPSGTTSVTSKSGRLRFDLSTFVDHHADTELRARIESDESKPAEKARHDQKHRLEKTRSALRTAPKVLQRANADLREIEANLLTMGKLFQYVEEAISEAHESVNEAIKLREDQLSIILRAYHGFDYLLQSSRLSPILEKSSDGGHTSPSSISTITDLAPTTMLSLQTLDPIEESYHLRDLLVNRIDQDVRRLFADVQKAHVWLRVIREVLRGLRRRVYFER